MPVKHTNALNDEEKRQLTGWGRDIFESEGLNLIWRPKEMHLILYENGQPVSHCGLIRQAITVNNNAVPIGGIGGVVTPPPHQHQGYARKLLQHALAEFATEQLPAALLFCREQLVPFYRQQGWQLINDSVLVLQPQGVIQFPASVMVYPLNQFNWPAGAINIDSPPW